MTKTMRWKPFKSKCARIEALLWEFASERLPLEQQARVQAHLSQCAVCQAQLRTYRQIGQGLEVLRAAKVPATQTHWSEVQARLAAGQASINAGQAAGQTAQTASRTTLLPVRRAGYSRLLVSGVAIAALALFCLRVVPHGSELQSSASQDKDRLLAWDSKPAPFEQTKPSEYTRVATAKGNGKTSFGSVKQPLLAYGMMKPAFVRYGLKNENAGLLVQSHPIMPDVRIAKLAIASGDMTGRQTFRGHRHSRFARTMETLRHHPNGVMLALREPTGTQLSTRGMVAMPTATPPMQQPLALSALPPEVPNYVLTVVEAEAEPATPRAYVMDCVSSRPDRAPNNTSGQTGEEERVW